MMLIAVITYAQEKNKKMTFDVNGKCAMCKERIEEAALNVKGVKYERKTDAMKIKTAIVAVGHDTKELKATEEAYNSVHPCCRYREDNSDDGQHHDGN